MRYNGKKTAIVTNCILIALAFTIFAVGFIPERIIPIYGGATETPIYYGNREHKNVSIMVNVYENAEIVKKMADEFNAHGAKATFFVGGCWADDNGETLKYLVSAGHEIANHGYFHKDHKKLDYGANVQEINSCGVVAEALCGVKPELFAPPSGSFGNDTLKAAADLGYKVIMWSKDTIDWRDKDESVIYGRAVKKPANGDFILMHPKEHSLKALPKILEFYISTGYNIVTVSDNIAV